MVFVLHIIFWKGREREYVVSSILAPVSLPTCIMSMNILPYIAEGNQGWDWGCWSTDLKTGRLSCITQVPSHWPFKWKKRVEAWVREMEQENLQHERDCHCWFQMWTRRGGSQRMLVFLEVRNSPHLSGSKLKEEGSLITTWKWILPATQMGKKAGSLSSRACRKEYKPFWHLDFSLVRPVPNLWPIEVYYSLG